MKATRIKVETVITRDEWLNNKMPVKDIENKLKYELMNKVSNELLDKTNILVKTSNGWIGETWEVDFTVMSTNDYLKLIKKLD
jgi:hypothetical protein